MVSAVVSAVASAEALAQLEELEVVPVNTGELLKMMDNFLSILCIKHFKSKNHTKLNLFLTGFWGFGVLGFWG